MCARNKDTRTLAYSRLRQPEVESGYRVEFQVQTPLRLNGRVAPGGPTNDEVFKLGRTHPGVGGQCIPMPEGGRHTR